MITFRRRKSKTQQRRWTPLGLITNDHEGYAQTGLGSEVGDCGSRPARGLRCDARALSRRLQRLSAMVAVSARGCRPRAERSRGVQQRGIETSFGAEWNGPPSTPSTAASSNRISTPRGCRHSLRGRWIDSETREAIGHRRIGGATDNEECPKVGCGSIASSNDRFQRLGCRAALGRCLPVAHERKLTSSDIARQMKSRLRQSCA